MRRSGRRCSHVHITRHPKPCRARLRAAPRSRGGVSPSPLHPQAAPKGAAVNPLMTAPRVGGEFVLPGDPTWDDARQAWNLAVDQQPAAVALPADADDVASAVGYARARGLRVAMQGTGHNAGPLGSLEDTVLVKTSRMRGVSIDAAGRRARVEAGVLWDEVVQRTSDHGLAALSGSSPDVGVVGYTLGGGLSWMARRHGLAASS